MAAVTVTTGFMVGVAPSSSTPVSAIPSTLSLFYGVLSSLFIAFHAVLIKSSLPHCNNSTIQLAWWTNFGSAIMILPFVLIRGEISTLWVMTQAQDWNGTVFAWGSLVTGIFGFLLCVAGLLSIKITSPITHMFSSVRIYWRLTISTDLKTEPMIRQHDLFFKLCLASLSSKMF